MDSEPLSAGTPDERPPEICGACRAARAWLSLMAPLHGEDRPGPDGHRHFEGFGPRFRAWWDADLASTDGGIG